MNNTNIKIYDKKIFKNLKLKEIDKKILLKIEMIYGKKDHNLLRFVEKLLRYNDYENIFDKIEFYMKNRIQLKQHTKEIYILFYGKFVGEKLFEEHTKNVKNFCESFYDKHNPKNIQRSIKLKNNNVFNKEYWRDKGLNDEEINIKFLELNNKRIEGKLKSGKKDVFPTQIGYWLKKGFSEDEAKEKIRERQSTNSVEAIMKRNNCSLEEAKAIRQEITDKFLKTMNSKSEEEKKEINKRKSESLKTKSPIISQAEFELAEILNCDQQLIVDIKNTPQYFIYDLYKGNKIIEYNGDYWHCNPIKYDKDYFNKQVGLSAEMIWIRDEFKIEYAKEVGYDILVIWEYDYNNNREETIKKCKEFLNG